MADELTFTDKDGDTLAVIPEEDWSQEGVPEGTLVLLVGQDGVSTNMWLTPTQQWDLIEHLQRNVGPSPRHLQTPEEVDEWLTS